MILDAPEGTEQIERLCRDSFVAARVPRRRAEALALLVESSHEGLMLIARAKLDIAPMIKVARELETTITMATAEGGSGHSPA